MINRHFPPNKGELNRRDFLKLSGFLGIGISSMTVVPAWAESVLFARNLYKVTRTRLSMGTFVTITVFDPSRDKAEEAIGKAFEEINRLTSLLSRFDSRAAVANLNSEGSLKGIPPEVEQVLKRSREIHSMTGGYFDISVKPVVDLFREKAEKGRFQEPSEKELKEALSLVGAEMIEVSEGSVRFAKPGMGITLDGIAKGFIVDRASALLKAHGVANHLVNAGGDIRAEGLRDDRKPWTIAIQDPNKGKEYPDLIRMSGGAVATSGNYEVFYDKERLFHHIVDPSTGVSPSAATSVSVTAPDAATADALATGVFVMGPEGGTRFLEGVAGCEGLIIAKAGDIFRTSGWRSAAI